MSRFGPENPAPKEPTVKAFIPGQMPKAVLEEIKRMNQKFLDSITETPEDNARRQECYDRWVESCNTTKRKKATQEVAA